jgi:hypothetical protein
MEEVDKVIVRVGLGYCTYLLSKTGYQIYRDRLISRTLAGSAVAGAPAEQNESAVSHSEISAQAQILHAIPAQELENDSTLEYEPEVPVLKTEQHKKLGAAAPLVACEIQIASESSEPESSTDSVMLQESGITIRTKIEKNAESIETLRTQCKKLCCKLQEEIKVDKPSDSVSNGSARQPPNQCTV